MYRGFPLDQKSFLGSETDRPPAGSWWRYPPTAAGIQVNHCKNPLCANFGIPPRHAHGSLRGKKLKGADPVTGDYTVLGVSAGSGPGTSHPLLKCDLCGATLPMQSNLAIAEELLRIGRYLDPAAGPACTNDDCACYQVPQSAHPSNYVSFGTNKAGTPRYRCQTCRPDVQASFGDQRIAFEVQLSTTFIRVIAERREFYLREGGMLIWLFQHFTEHDTRLTQDDVFYNNNRNAFQANEETLAASRATGRLHLECCWSAPARQNNEILLTQHRKIVSIDELTLDVERQRIFYFDFDQEMAKASVTPQQASATQLRRDFEAFWLSKPEANTQETLSKWYAFRRRFNEHGIQLSQYFGGDGTETLLNNLYSAKHGKVVGRSFKKFIEVAHRVAGGYKGHLWAFGLLLAAHNRVDQLWAEDENSGKWAAKRETFRPKIEAGDAAYRPDPKTSQLVSFLFPEIAERLGRYPVKSVQPTEL